MAQSIQAQLNAQINAFADTEPEDRADAVDAIMALTDRLLDEDATLPERERQAVLRAEKARLHRTDRVLFIAAGMCAVAGVAVIATVIWGSTPGVAVLGSLVSLALALGVALVTDCTEIATDDGPCVPSPELRWALGICAGLSGLAFAALAWDITSGWFGWLAMMLTGIPAFGMVATELASATSSTTTTAAARGRTS